MPARSDVITRLDETIDRHRDALRDLAAKIHAHPELRFEEHKAAAWIAETVEKLTGLPVERGVGNLPTALRVRAGSGPSRVAVLAEYDALPEIGHACGHNLIAAGAVAAFVALASHANDLGGAVDLLGTPAEEGGGGKITLIEAGLFQGVDAAMMFHPFDRDLLAHTALANVWLHFDYSGVPSHAAIAPHVGSSALTACLQTFQLIDSQRVHFRDGVRVHGFVTNGGQAVNIIPERASAEFSVRALTVAELERVRAIVERCARGAAMASGVEVKISSRRGYRDMQNNFSLARRFGEHLRRLGRNPRETDPRVGAGSTDMGDVSHTVPSIHPWIGICDEGSATCHQHAFAASAASDRGMDAMLAAAKGMAGAAADFLADESIRADVKREFESRRE
jgi:amidohydrolase